MKAPAPEGALFTRRLLHWHRTANQRSLPWIHERDPYKIWLSEIILQQTRAGQGIPFYERFLAAYPTVRQLANASDEAAFRLWQGLGYYNRCKHMLATARQIVREREGFFPDSYEGLLALKGIGPYTAAAIASFAYHLPQAVVDGNVYRVLARYFGIEVPFDSSEGKKLFQQKADELLDREHSAAYNQAIMDLGATVCTPLAPKCVECPLKDHCVALQRQLVSYLPVRSKRTLVRPRYFHYLLLRHEGRLWIHKRSGKDVWQNLHEPLLLEAEQALDRQGLLELDAYQKLGLPRIPEYEGFLSQRLTHQLIESRFFSLDLDDLEGLSLPEGNWVSSKRLNTLAFPKSLVSFFEKKLYF